MITARKLVALAKKQAARPTAAIRAAAITGPMIRERLKTDELSAIALSRSSLPTISITNDWRKGTSKAESVPRKTASAITQATVTRPVAVRIPSVSASHIMRL